RPPGQSTAAVGAELVKVDLRTARDHRLVQSDLAKRVERVVPQHEPAAGHQLARLGPPLQHSRLDSHLAQGDGGGEATDARADDESTLYARHGSPLVGCRRAS